MKKIFISTEYVTLNQFLKIAGLINNGGQAKFWLLENKVMVDEKIEDRRGRKLYDQMIVRIGNQLYQIVKTNE
ncbi:S4 domain-containing protein YaaA [Ureaplasma parvum]|uniref:S4 domain-containing protein YaaA n=1 Tax=Ureaplasma parvum TaxID=134821 RepID=UPI0026EA1E73|nr:S4 domain-containing protein YaaA [Ureaplasma parvum]